MLSEIRDQIEDEVVRRDEIDYIMNVIDQDSGSMDSSDYDSSDDEVEDYTMDFDV